jgi:hypothetical protein
MDTIETLESLTDKILSAFDQKATAKGKEKIAFIPEIKIKRENDILYVSEIRKTKMNTLMVTVEIYTVAKSDKAPMPLAHLNEVAQKQVLARLS